MLVHGRRNFEGKSDREWLQAAVRKYNAAHPTPNVYMYVKKNYSTTRAHTRTGCDTTPEHRCSANTTSHSCEQELHTDQPWMLWSALAKLDYCAQNTFYCAILLRANCTIYCAIYLYCTQFFLQYLERVKPSFGNEVAH